MKLNLHREAEKRKQFYFACIFFNTSQKLVNVFSHTSRKVFVYLFIYLIKQTKDPKVTNMSHSNESVVNTKRTSNIYNI